VLGQQGVITTITRSGIAIAPARVMTHRARTLTLRTVGISIFSAFALIAGFLLLEEHRAHVLGAVPYVLGVAGLVFCIFGHRHAGAWRADDTDYGGTR
jgi:hypothetical protein